MKKFLYVLAIIFMPLPALCQEKKDSVSMQSEKSVQSLKEVKITKEKPSLELVPGGYKFNVDKGISDKTGTIFEVLKQVPGITIDGSDNIKLQGREPVIMVNGRKVAMTGNDLVVYLRSITANQVSDIDLNTNPNARYDADGEGGILNIKLKQKTIPGFFGNISSDISSLTSTNNSININYRKNKWEMSGSYNFTYREDTYSRNNDYENRSLPDSLYRFRQYQISDQYQKGYSLKAGISYAADSTSTVSFNFFGAFFSSNNPWEIESRIFNRLDVYQKKYIQTENNEVNNDFYIYDLLYKKIFAKQYQLSLGFNYSRYANRSGQQFRRTFYNTEDQVITDQLTDNRTLQTGRPYQLTASNADYYKNLNKVKLELGVKYSTAFTKSYFKDAKQESLSNDLNYTEHVLAAYAQSSGKLNKITYQVGLRYEDFGYKLNSASLIEYRNRYKDLFPYLNLSYNSNDHKSTYALNFGRRIQRPGYSMLNPFLDVSTLGQYKTGNPYLKPYFVNKIEFQYSRTYEESAFLMISAFVSQSKDMFSHLFKYNSETAMNVDTYDNYRSTDQYGLYLIFQNKITKWFNLNTYVSGNRPVFSSKLPGDVLLPALPFFTSNLSLNFTVADKTQIQLYGYCVTRNNNFQLQNGTNGNISLAAQHKIFQSRLTVSVNFEDIFNFSRYPVYVYNPNVYLYSLNKLKSQYIKLGVNYSFGKPYSSKNNKELNTENRVN